MTIKATVERKRRARKGKGFNREELRQVGLSFNQALRLGVPIDTRRRSKHEENVKALKEHLKHVLKRA